MELFSPPAIKDNADALAEFAGSCPAPGDFVSQLSPATGPK
jgi:hypothetical protein